MDAPADTVFGYIRDMREHHPKFLPPEFSDFQVESGGVGTGDDHAIHGESRRPDPQLPDAGTPLHEPGQPHAR